MTVLLVILQMATLGGSPSGAAPQADPVREILSDRRFEFCHRAGYPLTAREAQLCPIWRSAEGRCPRFGDVCAAQGRATEVPPPRRFELPDLAAVPRALLLALLAVAVVAGLAVLVRQVRTPRRRPDEAEEPAPAAAAVEVAAGEVAETDVDRLLARARAAAAAGDLAAAIAGLHAALLRRLEGAGVLALHPSRTNGDYVRAVAAARPELATPVGSFVADVERVQYGARAPTPDLFQSLLARLPTLLGLALVLGVGGCGRERGDPEHSPSGRAGVVALLERVGHCQVRERLAPVARLAKEDADTLVVFPTAELGADDWLRVRRWVADDGGTLVMAGVPEKPPKWLQMEAIGSTLDTAPVIGTRRFVNRHGVISLRVPPAPAMRPESRYLPLLTRGTSGPLYAADRHLGKGRLLVLADDRLFTNGLLAIGDTGRVLLALLEGSKRLELVGELTGVMAPNPVASISRGRLAPFLGQLALVCAVFFLYRGAAFGRLREPPPARRRSFVEHVEALATQYARARAARHVLASYGQYVIERLRERVSLPSDAGLIALADAVAARTGRAAGEVMRLLMEAREVPAPAAPGTAADVAIHLQAVRALAELTARPRTHDRPAEEP